MNVIETLIERGFIDALTHDDIKKICNEQITVYIGFDPTAESLHLGNMVALMGLSWFQKFGHKTVAVVGGATGLIGDPSGKSHERPQLDSKTLEKNLIGIKKNVSRFIDIENSQAPALVLNNYDWFSKFSYIDFLRDIGKHFRLGPMLSKDSVKSRLNSPEGISYTEFSYQCLQGYDFYHLFKEHGVQMQMGGSDQWGNITAGTDLIRKLTGENAYGATFPLLTRSDGKKFGKSEKGAIWLSESHLSPYEFYQYIYTLPDSDIPQLMRMLTFMDLEEIRDYEKRLKDPNSTPNIAQKRLAEEVTRIVHGKEGLETALKVTAGAKPGSSTQLDIETLEAISGNMPCHEIESHKLGNLKLIELLEEVKLVTSKGEARRLLKNGGVYLNNEKIIDDQRKLHSEDLVGNRLFLIGVGKKKKMIVRIK